MLATKDPEDKGETNALMPRHSVEALVALRNAALKKFEDAHAALLSAAESQKSANMAWGQVRPPREDRFTFFARPEKAKFIASIEMIDLTEYMDTARRMVDQDVWSHVIQVTDLDRLMDKEAKDQFQKQLKENPPEATVDNICATLQQFAATAGDVFRRGIANAFSKLDRKFRSHDGFKVGSRVILDRMFSESGSYNYHRDQESVLSDIERTFLVLDERPVGANYGGIVGALRNQKSSLRREQGEVENEFFLIRYYMNGNAHLWMKRKDLVKKVNKLLAEWYGETIGDGMQANEDPLNDPKLTPAKRYGFFPTPDKAVEQFFQGIPVLRRKEEPVLRILEPSAGTGNLARRCVTRPDKVSAMMPDYQRERIAKMNAEYRYDNHVDCVEVQVDLALALRRERIYRNVICTDFLSMQKPDDADLYDIVVMNPPFDRERDIDHVVHALNFLKPSGMLFAIMSAGTEFRETKKSIAFRKLVGQFATRWEDLPAGSFSSVGTNCNTIILRMWKDGRRRFY